MGRFTWISATAASLALGLLFVGCSSNQAANQKNFIRGLNLYYASHDECLYPSAPRFPYEASVTDKTPTLDALADAGLLERKEERAIQVKRYSLTSFAKSHVSSRFCYGHREVTGVDSFTPPAPVNGWRTTQVEYHYQMRDVPGWAKSSEMRAAFPALAKATTGQPQGAAKLVLTAVGWRVPE